MQVQTVGPAQKSQSGSSGPPAIQAAMQAIPTASQTLHAGGISIAAMEVPASARLTTASGAGELGAAIVEAMRRVREEMIAEVFILIDCLGWWVGFCLERLFGCS